MVKQNWISIDKVKISTKRKTPTSNSDLQQELGILLNELQIEDFEHRKTVIKKLNELINRKQITEISLEESDYIKITLILLEFLAEDNSTVFLSTKRGFQRMDELMADDTYSVHLNTEYILERMGKTNSDLLITALDSHLNIRGELVYLLGYYKDAKAVDSIIKLITDENERVRVNAIIALGKIGDKRATEPILRILKDENSKNRIHAISTLKELKDPKVIDPLIPFLKDEDWKVRRAVIDVLGEIDDDRVVKLLIKSLDDKQLTKPALWKLEKYTEGWVIELLFDKLKDEELRYNIDLFKLLEKMLSEQTLNSYIQALKNEHSQVRSNAAALLGKFGSTQVFEPLLEALSDENSDVRCRVIWALGEIGDERAITPLVNMFKEEREVKENGKVSLSGFMGAVQNKENDSIVHALQNIGNKSEQAILDFMEANPNIVSYPIKTLGKVGGKKSEDKLMLGLENSSEDVRQAAIEGLGRIESSKAIESIIEKLIDESRFVRNSAVKALTIIGGEQAFNALVKNLTKKEGFVNSNIVEALGAIGDLRAVDYLIQILNQKGYNRKIVKALGKLGDPRAAQPIIDNLTYSPDDMPSAVYALVKLGDKGIEEIFDLIRTGGYPFEVEPAAEALSEIKDIKYLDSIIEFLSYTNNSVPDYVIETVRSCAIEALANFDDPRAIDILIETIKDDSVLVSMRRSAIRAIVNVNDPQVVDILIETLEDNYAIEEDNLILRWNAIKALGEVKDPRSIRTIIEVLSYCPNHIVKRETRKYVIEALEQFDEENVVDTLIEMLKNKDAKVRESAVWVLGRMKDSKSLGPLEDLYKTETDHRVLFELAYVIEQKKEKKEKKKEKVNE